MSVTVRTQAELDAAIKAGETTIYIASPADVCIYCNTPGSSHVVAWGSSHVEAWGSSHVEARESSHVVARESSHVEAWESSHVVARESSHVEAWESSHVVASRHVAVTRQSVNAACAGGVLIDMTEVDLRDPAGWCEHVGALIAGDVVTLYKACDADLAAGSRYIHTSYAVGTEVVATDWRDDNECGNGLHLSPTPGCATTYRPDAKRWVRVEVALTDIRPILDGDTAKCKVPRCRVVAEVDRWGAEVTR